MAAVLIPHQPKMMQAKKRSNHLLCGHMCLCREHWSLLADSSVPKLVVQGTKDKYTPLTTLRDYAAQVSPF